MLTQKKKHTSGKYVLIIPALMACSLLFAKSNTVNTRIRVGDQTTFMGNTFYWSKAAIDSILIQDEKTKKTRYVVMQKDQIITRVNDGTVFPVDVASIQPQFRFENKDFVQYLEEHLKKELKNVPDSIAQIQIKNVVLDGNGKIIYYDMLYWNTKKVYGSSANSANAALDPIFATIIDNAPQWLPATIDGAPVSVFLPYGGTIALRKD